VRCISRVQRIDTASECQNASHAFFARNVVTRYGLEFWLHTDLKYCLTPVGSCIEGDWNEVMALVSAVMRRCVRAPNL
jgi:hypothetical protein